MRITQQDIARIANVSQATVSRVLAGDDRVEDEIRQRVLVAIEENNYRPDVRAQSLRTQQTHLIGLVVKRQQGALKGDPFFALLISEILDCLSESPYHLCVDTAASQSVQKAVYDELLRSRRVDGLILVESEAHDERVLRLQKEGFPFVLIGKGADGIPSVDNDNELAGKLAARHLIDNGFRRVAMIAGPEGLTVSEDRIAGYKAVVGEFDQEPVVVNSRFGYEAARDTAKGLLSHPRRPDALVVLDDFMALGVVEAARELKIKIPDELGVISFNDTIYCTLVDGGLSSISLNLQQIVRTACQRLLQIIEGQDVEDVKRVIVPCELRIRGSSVRQGRA
ncbi:MAG: LacI family transcriptional regulator [Fimbriimonadaceae bacterium]|nr:LacI family transcriptional regulator [Fimbriimonadaceae bacterium]